MRVDVDQCWRMRAIHIVSFCLVAAFMPSDVQSVGPWLTWMQHTCAGWAWGGEMGRMQSVFFVHNPQQAQGQRESGKEEDTLKVTTGQANMYSKHI